MKIKNFTGMGQDGLYYVEGMTPNKINGKDILFLLIPFIYDRE